MEITYRTEGDYQLPNLEVRNKNAHLIGKYGRMRQKYLMEEQNTRYSILLMTEKLVPHLLEIDKLAKEMKEDLVLKLKKEQGVTEALKEKDQLMWVQLMNNIDSEAEEIVIKELCYI